MSNQSEKRLQVMIPTELHGQFKAACATDGEDMRAVLERLVTGFLKYRNEAKEAKAK
ncbi:hypothetical protein K4M64_004528 [Salmonella enterica]|nr:hypothetical protein [Salmonella enterica]